RFGRRGRHGPVHDIPGSHPTLLVWPSEATLADDTGVDVDQRNISLNGHDENAKFRSRAMSRWFIGIGLVLVMVGLLWPWLGRLGLGRLPGDIVIERETFRCYFPIVTCLVVSGVVSLI